MRDHVRIRVLNQPSVKIHTNQSDVVDVHSPQIQIIERKTDVIYDGEYTVIPKITEQTLETEGKVMTDNVTVRQIPYYSVSNPQNGETVYIGSTI